MTNKEKHPVTLGDIIGLMERFAPLSLAEPWDNCGLQVGDAGWPARKIWVALDPLLAVIEAANQRNVDLVVTHHPLLIKPIHRVDLKTNAGKIIAGALRSRTAIYSAHTNLDSTFGGVNDILARRIGLTDLTALIPAEETSENSTRDQSKRPSGLGRVGKLATKMTVAQLAVEIKEKLSLATVRIAGDENRWVHRAAICSGSGGGLLDAFLESGADVYISGDLKYHDARLIEDAGRAMIDVGHFASEHLVIDPLVRYLECEIKSAGWDVAVEACRLERDPFAIF